MTSKKRVDTTETLELLCCERRRAVVRCLSERDSRSVTLGALATAVEDRTEGVDRSVVETYLHHVDLPKLESAGVVEYDAHANRAVCLDTDRLASIVDAVETHLE